MFKRLVDWGFTQQSWKGLRGEYWVLAQGVLMVTYVVIPRYTPWNNRVPSVIIYSCWAIAFILGLGALYLLVKGLIDLGPSLTPLPYPREDSELVQTGVYGIVRHCLYSGLILLAIAGTLFWLSLSHFLVTLLVFWFFDAKATKEEQWLCQRYSDYPSYQQRVKKLVPGLY